MQLLDTIYSNDRQNASSAVSAKERRTDYQRDYDRIIFSSAFRRLQNKTQVFPLPGSVFVHNRLTHSLEVASVGRSIAYEIGQFVINKYPSISDESKYFYEHNLQNVISSACLCHDIGNPAFGHSGEDAIATYFKRNEERLRPWFTDKQWSDLICFEGNANAIRILTQTQNGKLTKGLSLTASTLSAIAKYPCESIARDKSKTHRKKFGFFQTEKENFLQMTAACGMIQEESNPIIFKRHPFVWLTEAADDICYNIIDVEDAHRLGLLDTPVVENLFLQLLLDLDFDIHGTKDTLNKLANNNERISYLRAKAINALVQQVVDVYTHNFESILQGEYTIPLFDHLRAKSQALKDVLTVSIDKIYNNKSVIQIENAGYNVMYELLSHFVEPTLRAQRINADKMALKLLPDQFQYDDGTAYEKVMGIIDFISGMTDNFATDLYRKIKGIDIGMSF
ncbi:dNTP triphosphohydrolase [Saprospiraceae bacterium]|nr:dNTP triphosphohydrolase [Saprospiraceae bacterium]